jgi:glucose/arabinose dehydrogenase
VRHAAIVPEDAGMGSPTPRSTRLRAGAAAAVLVAVAGCGAGGPESIGEGVTPDPPPSATSPATASTAPTTSEAAEPVDALPTGAPGPAAVLAEDLPLPWSLATLPDDAGWLLSLRDEATVRHVARDGTVTPVATAQDDGRVPGTDPQGEGGLLGLAVLEEADRTWVYAYQTVSGPQGRANQVVRMPLDGAPGSYALGAPEAVVTGIPAARIHNGGRLAFGPDAMLYVSTGDAGETSRSQDPASLGGKILRVTPEGEPAPGNPFAGSPVWSLGHRNVQGLGWDGEGRMFASEFGQNTFDELNLIEAGANYGWPVVEGAGGDPDYRDPLVTWATSQASPSGLVVTGDAVYLAALRGERLWRVPLVAGEAVVGPPEALLVGEQGRLRDVVVDDGPQGPGLLVLTNDGEGDRVLRLPLG